MNTPSWKILFKQTIQSYFKWILLFVGNIVLVVVATVFLDLSIILSNRATVFHVFFLALVNVVLVFTVSFSFIQLHRYLVGRTVQRAGNALLEHYVTPAIEATIAKISVPSSDITSDSAAQQLKRNLLQQVKKEHISSGVKYLLLLVFRRVNLKNIQWKGNKQLLASSINKRTSIVLTALAAIGDKILWFCFLASWFIVLILAVFRFYLYKF